MTIHISINVLAPLSQVWECWTQPEHITKWNFASEDWHCPSAINDLQPNGKFSWRMEAKDGTMGFDFEGVYDEVNWEKSLSYHLGDHRTVSVSFSEINGVTTVHESFETEDQNSAEMQKTGWLAILTNFKKHVEGLR